MTWLTDVDLYGSGDRRPLDIEFVEPPELLIKYSSRVMPGISSISAEGIGFYLILPPIWEGRVVYHEGIDGTVFCPMSNIKSISTFGGLDTQDIDY